MKKIKQNPTQIQIGLEDRQEQDRHQTDLHTTKTTNRSRETNIINQRKRNQYILHMTHHRRGNRHITQYIVQTYHLNTHHTYHFPLLSNIATHIQYIDIYRVHNKF